MSTPKTIERRAFLGSTVATVTASSLGGTLVASVSASLAACTDESSGVESPLPAQSGSASPSGNSLTGSATGSNGTPNPGVSTGASASSVSHPPVLDSGLPLDAGSQVLCATSTFNGNHSHPLLVPNHDIQTELFNLIYLLEDGGTGHTHTVTVTSYDIFTLQGGTTVELLSTTDAGHEHTCSITCPPSDT